MCTICQKKDYTCLGCDFKIKYDDYKSKSVSIAMSCDCCDHNFVCLGCWKKYQHYDYWTPKFGFDHSVVNHVTGQSRLSDFLKMMISTNYPTYELNPEISPEIKEEMDKSEKRRNYTSLDEFVKEEGIETVLEWLSRSPTEIVTENERVYRHTKMKSVNYIIKKSDTK
jgi:hypothetical protein